MRDSVLTILRGKLSETPAETEFLADRERAGTRSVRAGTLVDSLKTVISFVVGDVFIAANRKYDRRNVQKINCLQRRTAGQKEEGRNANLFRFPTRSSLYFR